MRLLSSTVLASALGCLALTACSFEPFQLGSETKGQNGKLAFHYSSSQCGFGCALDRPVVLGAMITVQATGGDPDVRYGLRLASPDMGTLVPTEACTCTRQLGASSSESHPVDAATACASGEKKSCVESADIQTLAAGDATLLVVDPAGNTVDSVGFAVRPAERIDSTVSVNGAAVQKASDGTYPARAGDRVSVHSVVYSGTAAMVFTKHGLIPEYSDSTVLASAGDTLGATDVEDAVAKGPGTATLTMKAQGADATVNVRVAK
jgi:hypothetical protein